MANVEANPQPTELERLRAWESQVIDALKGLPDNTAPDAIRALRDAAKEARFMLRAQGLEDTPGFKRLDETLGEAP